MIVNGCEIKAYANLRVANLRDADLRYADLRYANLRGANLRDANLRDADLRDADLRDADLSNADLRGADLRDADLRRAKLPDFQLVPEKGSFTGWKKLADGQVIELLIPEDAERTSSLIGRKCRASYVIPKGTGVSERGGKYFAGEGYHPDKYDDDIRVECTHGVHFFITKKEAENY